MDHLIREDDRAVFGDKGYVNEAKKRAAGAAGVYWAGKDQRKPGRQLSSSQKKRNRRHGAIRAKSLPPRRRGSNTCPLPQMPVRLP